MAGPLPPLLSVIVGFTLPWGTPPLTGKPPGGTMNESIAMLLVKFGIGQHPPAGPKAARIGELLTMQATGGGAPGTTWKKASGKVAGMANPLAGFAPICKGHMAVLFLPMSTRGVPGGTLGMQATASARIPELSKMWPES